MTVCRRTKEDINKMPSGDERMESQVRPREVDSNVSYCWESGGGCGSQNEVKESMSMHLLHLLHEVTSFCVLLLPFSFSAYPSRKMRSERNTASITYSLPVIPIRCSTPHACLIVEK